MRRLDVVQWGPDRLRVAPWRGDTHVAVVTPSPGQPAHPASVDHATEVLQDRGIDRVLTAALPPAEQEPFLARGFSVRERLHLLAHDLDALPVGPDLLSTRLRRGWRRDYPLVLAVDDRAFPAFWRFDRDALVDARGATPSSQFRVAEAGEVVGYAITGRAGDTAYLQRLAVDPSHQGLGIGTTLVIDALGWARARRVGRVLVNTQIDNHGAVALYEHLGFRRLADGLAVLERVLDPAQATA